MDLSLRTNIVPEAKLKSVTEDVLRILAESVSTSFGPGGATSILRAPNGTNVFTKDGKTILDHIRFLGPLEDSIYTTISEVAMKVATLVGDGTTSSIIASNELYKKLSNKGLRQEQLMKLLHDAKETIVTELYNSVRKTISDEDMLSTITKLANVSLNGDEALTSLITELYEKVGRDGYITYSYSKTKETYIETSTGYQIDSGFVDPVLINTGDNTFTAEDAKILIFDSIVSGKIYLQLLEAVINEAFVKQQPLIIMAPDFDIEAQKVLRNLFTFVKGKYGFVNIIQIPNGISRTHKMFEDTCAVLGARPIYISLEEKPSIENGITFNEEWFGSAKKVVSNEFITTFYEPEGFGTEEVSKRLEYIETELRVALSAAEPKDIEITQLRKRKAMLTSSLGTIFVGGDSEAEQNVRFHAVEDAVLAVKSALTDGYVVGANLAIPVAITNVQTSKSDNENIVMEAISSTFMAMCELLYTNAHVDTETEPFKSFCEGPTYFAEKGEVYDIRTGKLSKDIINSVKTDVVILETALSIIGIILTSKQFILPDPQVNSYVLMDFCG